ARGHFRHSGRSDFRDRRDAAGPARGGDARARRAQDDRQHGGLRVRARREIAAPSLEPRRQRACAAPARPRDFARPQLCPCARLVGLNPNDDLIVVQQGEVLTWLGRPEEGIPWIEKAMRLNTYHPERFWNHLGRAFFVARRYADAITAFSRIAAPDHLHHAFLAACHAALGNESSARNHVAEVLKRDPAFCIENYLKTQHYKRPEDLEHHRAA